MFKNNTSFNVLYTTNVESTHKFYSKLGLVIKELAKDKVVVSFGNFDLHFILNSAEPFEDYKYVAEPESYGQGVIFYIEVEDIYQAEVLVKQAGGVIKKSVFDNLWGAKELLFEDSNGYKFALYQQEQSFK